MSLLLISSPAFADHVTPPGHPERVERAEVMDVIAGRWREAGGAVVEPQEVTDEALAAVHDPGYLATVADTRGRATMFDADTFTSPETVRIARLAAGAAVQAVDHVLGTGAGSRVLALVRPPGHHAERDRAMGFCFYNSVAVAASHARRRGLERVAIVDYDVHHGNGTQHTFTDEPSVLFMSSHQFPFYPGTGAATEVGRGEGAGFTVNVPMEVGATDADYDFVYRDGVIPVLEAFRPQLLLISAGFDAHELDPLAGMRMTSDGYGRLTGRLLEAADRLCEGRAVLVTEGGYHLSALADCLTRVVQVASGNEQPDLTVSVGDDNRRGREALRQIAAVQRRFWPSVFAEAGA